jgi:hypothetical protein
MNVFPPRDLKKNKISSADVSPFSSQGRNGLCLHGFDGFRTEVVLSVGFSN